MRSLKRGRQVPSGPKGARRECSLPLPVTPLCHGSTRSQPPSQLAAHVTWFCNALSKHSVWQSCFSLLFPHHHLQCRCDARSARDHLGTMRKRTLRHKGTQYRGQDDSWAKWVSCKLSHSDRGAFSAFLTQFGIFTPNFCN